MSKSGEALSKALVVAPNAALSVFRTIMDVAIDGAGPLPGARKAAGATLNRKGEVEAAIDALVRSHIGMAGAQGFLANLGGWVTIPVALPANMGALATLQARMVAAISHLRGYDVDDPRVRTAIFTCLLTQDSVDELIRNEKIPSTPMAMATAPVSDPELEKTVATHVVETLGSLATGKRVAVMGMKKIPLLGVGIGAGTDGMATWQVARYAKEQFPSRRMG